MRWSIQSEQGEEAKGTEIAEMGVQIPGWQDIILIKWINNKSKAMEMPAAGEISLKSAF